MSPRVALLVNPAAGTGKARNLGARVAQRLASRADVTTLAGGSREESIRLLESVREGYDAVVVAGGDGIVHLALQALAQSPVPLGIVPIGTGNDVADCLGIAGSVDTTADQVLAALEAGSIRDIDLGRTTDGTWWATVLCSGFDSAVNERANGLRWPAGPRRYDLAILLELVRLAPRPFTLTVDGSTQEIDATLVAVGNGPQYGGGKRITPAARFDDGLLHVTVVEAVSRRTLIRLAPKLPHAGHIGHPKVRVLTGRSITVVAPDTTAYADGERVGPLPVSTECVPGAIRVLVPRAVHRS